MTRGDGIGNTELKYLHFAVALGAAAAMKFLQQGHLQLGLQSRSVSKAYSQVDRTNPQAGLVLGQSGFSV
jgi:hypothetical protein